MDAHQVNLSEHHPISPALDFLLEQAIPPQTLYDAALKAYHQLGWEMQEMRAAVEDLAKIVRQIGADDDDDDEDFTNTKAIQLTGHIVREHRVFVEQLRALQAEHIQLWLDLHYLHPLTQKPPAQPTSSSNPPNPREIDPSLWNKGVDEFANCTRVCQKGRYRIQIPSPRERPERGRDMRPWYPDLGWRTLRAEERWEEERERERGD